MQISKFDVTGEETGLGWLSGSLKVTRLKHSTARIQSQVLAVPTSASITSPAHLSGLAQCAFTQD